MEVENKAVELYPATLATPPFNGVTETAVADQLKLQLVPRRHVEPLYILTFRDATVFAVLAGNGNVVTLAASVVVFFGDNALALAFLAESVAHCEQQQSHITAPSLLLLVA